MIESVLDILNFVQDGIELYSGAEQSFLYRTACSALKTLQDNYFHSNDPDFRSYLKAEFNTSISFWVKMLMDDEIRRLKGKLSPTSSEYRINLIEQHIEKIKNKKKEFVTCPYNSIGSSYEDLRCTFLIYVTSTDYCWPLKDSDLKKVLNLPSEL